MKLKRNSKKYESRDWRRRCSFMKDSGFKERNKSELLTFIIIRVFKIEFLEENETWLRINILHSDWGFSWIIQWFLRRISSADHFLRENLQVQIRNRRRLLIRLFCIHKEILHSSNWRFITRNWFPHSLRWSVVLLRWLSLNHIWRIPFFIE